MSQSPIRSDFIHKLEQFRQQIDEIDHELFELILKRADIVQQVGDLKDQHDDTHVKLRPAREARQLKKIYDQFKNSPFPEASALMIWRHLINGSLMVESPLRILTLKEPQALPDFAREYFGCYADMDFVDTPEELLERLRNDKVDVALFPMPMGRSQNPWWLSLARKDKHLKAFLKFPYLPTACVRDGSEVIAVSQIADEEPNEYSHTAFVLEVEPAVNPLSLKQVIAKALKDVRWHCSTKLENESVVCFITVPYMVALGDNRLKQVIDGLEGERNHINVVGHYAGALGVDYG